LPFWDDSKNAQSSLLAPMVVASPNLEKQGFFAVVFLDREYRGQRDGLY